MSGGLKLLNPLISMNRCSNIYRGLDVALRNVKRPRRLQRFSLSGVTDYPRGKSKSPMNYAAE
jgi:hypothetical protein